MARRTIVVDSYIWMVYPAGRITVYGKDASSLAELTERQLQDLFRRSQPAWTSPESGYGAR